MQQLYLMSVCLTIFECPQHFALSVCVQSLTVYRLPGSFRVDRDCLLFLLQDHDTRGEINGLWVPGGQRLVIIFPDLEACYIGTFDHSLCSLDFRDMTNICCLPGNFCIWGPDEPLGPSFKSEQNTGVN